MPPKPRFLPMPRDDQVLDAHNKAVEEWILYARSDEVCQKVCNFITSLRCRNARVKKMHNIIKGGYNLVYRLEYDDCHSVVMRVPIKDQVPFPDEKVMYEVCTMRYVAANTAIPIPHIYHYGDSTANPTGLGPFIVMEYIDHYTNMSRELLDRTKPADSRPVLDPAVSEDKIESLYGEMAKILLQLYELGPFARIGSLVQDGFESWDRGLATAARGATPNTEVGGRPLTVNMIDLMTDTGAPHSVLPRPTQTFDSAKEWYTTLAQMHMAQLVFQGGDCVEDEDDARDKYVARELFRTLAASDRLLFPWRKGTFSTTDDASNSEPCMRSASGSHLLPSLSSSGAADGPPGGAGFRLFSEDLRPANVLLDKDLKVIGVIDWEFVYSAPAAFSSDPPWWLLLCQPEDYPGGIISWMKEYDKRLDVFLRVLEMEELQSQGAAKLQDGKPSGESRYRRKSRRAKRHKEPIVTVIPEPLLSHQMRESWETGRWMVNYSARKSWMFDLVWWRFLDGAYFGANEDQDRKARLLLLTEEQHKQMEEFVASKIRNLNTGGTV